MALGAAIAFFGLHLEDADLLAEAVLDHIGGDGSALDNRSAELGAVLVDHSQNAVKLHGVASGNIQLLNEEDIALSHTVLLTAGLDNRMFHCHISSFLQVSLSQVKGFFLINLLNAALIDYHTGSSLSI